MPRPLHLPSPRGASTPRTPISACEAAKSVLLRRSGSALALIALLTASAGCSGDDVGGSETDNASDTTGSSSGDSGSDSSTSDTTTTDATTTDATITDATTTDATTTDATTTDATTTDGPDNPPDLPQGQCWSEYHGAYWCECNSPGNTKMCEGGVSTCFEWNATVITHTRWGPCGSCSPGEELPCDIDGDPGRIFCNVVDASVNDIDNLPIPEWGSCILSESIVCEPGESQATCENGIHQHCELDLDGVPYWTECP